MQLEWDKQVAQLAELIVIINGKLSSNERKKLITLCTIDVHARDVLQRLIDERVDSRMAFQWQSQLRYSQHAKTKECQVGKPLLFLFVTSLPGSIRGGSRYYILLGRANATLLAACQDLGVRRGMAHHLYRWRTLV